MLPDLLIIVLLGSCFLFLIIAFIYVGNKYNKTDWGNSILNLLDGFISWYCYRYHRLENKFIDLPQTGGAILLCNHVSGLDPLLIIAATKRPLRFMIAQEQYDRWWLKWLLKSIGVIPVKRDKNPRKAMALSLKALERDEILVIFPQGGIVDEKIDNPLKKGAFLLADISNKPVYLVRIKGVKALGMNVVAVFIRSKVSITQVRESILVSQDNLKFYMTRAKEFFETGNFKLPEKQI